MIWVSGILGKCKDLPVGSLMKEVKPPSTMGRIEVGEKLYSNKTNEIAQQRLYRQQEAYFCKKKAMI